MFLKKLLFWLLIVLLHTNSFSQVKLSPQLKKEFHFEAGKTLLTLSVKDLDVFKKKYADRVLVRYCHVDSKLVDISYRQKNLLNELENDPNILFVDHHEKVKEESALDFTNANFNRITKAHAAFATIAGSNQKISIKEQAFDTTDIDLVNRSFITAVTPATVSQHATTMATLIAGGGNSSWRATGVVSRARITSSDFLTLAPDDPSTFKNNNIKIQNHSYGVGIENYYGNEAMAYDLQVYQNPTLLHVFSSGNSGKSQPSSGTYKDMTFANITGNFKQAKNVLVVNAVDSTLLINVLNSRGPAFDGRVKPELTAFGQGGTSEAAALASGISMLVQEKYLAVNNEYPDASMIKAILIASADDIGPKGIDYLYGYGSINAYNALRLVETNQLAKINLPGNSQTSIPINIPASTSEIKIAVAWTDPPASVNATNVLKNDVDSWLNDGNITTLPWVLSSYPSSDSLLALPKRKSDHLNNVEYITMSNPSAGSYQLFLKSAVSAGAQKISVAYWLNQQKQFSWDFPDSTQIVQGASKSLLTWEAAGNQMGDLYLQINQGTWQLIKSGIDLNKYFNWSAPDLLAKAKLKMVIGANQFITDEFMISPMLKLDAAFNCADSIGLVWNSTNPTSSYEVYAMGSQYLTKSSTSPDTLEVLPKSGNLFFAIAPTLNGKVGLKSETIDYTKQGAFCYLNLFAAERFTATEVKVQLSLSSWYNVDHVTIFKVVNGTMSTFATVMPSSLLDLNYIDSALTPGSITYSAKIIFKNGITIYSNEIEIPIESKGKAILYPNPVSASASDLNIISAGGGSTLRIADVYGRTLIEKNLEQFQEVIDVVGLSSGLYIYQLLSGNQVTDTGRFVKY